MTTGLARFGRPQTALVCNLGTSGTLPNHTPGAAYSGTFNVTNRVGAVTAELVSATPALPDGWSLAVNQATGVVTLAWPAAAPLPGSSSLPNLNFEAGTDNWILGNGWIIDGAGLQDGGTQSARYRGAGQSSMLHAQLVPVTPGTTITATARVSTGITREDFAGGEAGLLWYNASGQPIAFSGAINDPQPRGPAFQTVITQGTAPAGAAFVRLFVSASRDIKGRARDSVYVDDLTWSHTYTLPGSPATDYDVVIRVRDGRGCQATFSQAIVQVVTTWNPQDLGARLVLSNNNLSVTRDIELGWSSVRATTSKSSGKWYFEILRTAGADKGEIIAGMMELANGLGGHPGQGIGPAFGVQALNASDVYLYQGGFIGVATGHADVPIGSGFQFAVDVGLRRAWVKAIAASGWIGGGDPAANTSPTFSWGPRENAEEPPAFPAVGIFSSTAVATANFGASSFLGVVPTGFIPINN